MPNLVFPEILSDIAINTDYSILYMISIAKIASKKIGALIRSMKFISPEVTLYKSTIRPFMEYCFMSGLLASM